MTKPLMSSKELALIVWFEHSDMLRKIRALIEKKEIEGALTYVKCKKNNRNNPVYWLGYEATIRLVENLDSKRKDRVLDRWRELENNPNSKYVAPTMNPVQQVPSETGRMDQIRTRVGSGTRYVAIEAVAIATGEQYPERPLALWCRDEQITPLPVEDLTGALVPGWPAAAWWEVYEVDISELFK